jgi:hypothetical protein
MTSQVVVRFGDVLGELGDGVEGVETWKSRAMPPKRSALAGRGNRRQARFSAR